MTYIVINYRNLRTLTIHCGSNLQLKSPIIHNDISANEIARPKTSIKRACLNGGVTYKFTSNKQLSPYLQYRIISLPP